jgi:ParB family chromosome partitioning protein
LQEQLARRAVSDGWSVRTLEDAVKHGLPEPEPSPTPTRGGEGGAAGGGSSTPPSQRLRAPGLLELEQLLAEHLSTRVSVSMGAKKGKVVIEFADLVDLERIYHQMTTQSGQDS